MPCELRTTRRARTGPHRRRHMRRLRAFPTSATTSAAGRYRVVENISHIQLKHFVADRGMIPAAQHPDTDLLSTFIAVVARRVSFSSLAWYFDPVGSLNQRLEGLVCEGVRIVGGRERTPRNEGVYLMPERGARR